MEILLRVLGIWGVADSVWMAVAPAGWARFWGYWVGRVGQGRPLGRLAAVAQLALSLYLVTRGGRTTAWRG